VQIHTITQPIRTVATVVPDESRVSHVHTRVAGWIEKLYVTTTGEHIRAGQPLAGIFSQELLASQTEYLAARRAAASGPRSAVLEGARARRSARYDR
jgi:Cu(I)/Ag(I) efflux system membrane fusion protein